LEKAALSNLFAQGYLFSSSLLSSVGYIYLTYCQTHKMSAYNDEDIQEIACKEQRRNRDKNPEVEFARIEFGTTMAAVSLLY
jgi:hypothetical protein